MRIFAGTDGRVYFAAGEMIVSLTADEAIGAMRDLADATSAASVVASQLAERPRPMPREVTRERLR